MIKVVLNGTERPVHFGWLELENISNSIESKSPEETANNINSLVQNLRFNRVVLFEGIKAGYRRIGESCPFATAEDVADEIQNFAEALPAIEYYIKRQAEFFNVEDEKPTKKKETVSP